MKSKIGAKGKGPVTFQTFLLQSLACINIDIATILTSLGNSDRSKYVENGSHFGI